MRQFNLNVVITLVLLLVICITINCPYEYVEVFRTDGHSAALKFDEESTLISGRTISMAGWPLKFLVRMSYADLPTATAFSFASLLANIALWAIAIVVLTFYEHRIYRALVKVDGQKRRLTLFDLLAATSFFALLAGYWQYSQSLTVKELRLADEISNRGGRTVETLLLPRPWVAWMSKEKFWTIRRISEVTLNLPDDGLIKQTVALPYLQRLSIGGGEYDLAHLKDLNHRPLLSHLRLSGRKLDPPTVTRISSLEQLQSLNLMKTNVTADAVPQLARLPRLQSLNLIHSDVRLENFTSGEALSHVRELYLPRPKNGQGDSLRLANCPDLKKLVCNAYDQPLNSSPVHLDLASLPALQTIELDAFQLFHLRCSNLPELSQIVPLHLQYQMRCSKSGVPAQLWLGSVELTGVEKLKSLASSAEDLQLLSVEGHPDLHVALSNERLEDERSRGRVGMADRSVSPASSTLSKLFESLASENGPSRLSLRGLDLRGMNFSTLSQNQRLSYVDIWDSRLKPNQWLAIGQLNGLEELRAAGDFLTPESLSQVIAQASSLKRLQCLPGRSGTLTIRDQPHLQRLFPDGAYLEFITGLQLESVPELSESLHLPPDLRSLIIDQAPALKGLTTSGPWPSQSRLQGLRDLEVFVAGGANVDDAVVEAILKCSQLKHVTLAHCSVSPAALSKLSQLNQLTSLTLTGSNVNDQVLQNLTQLKTLRSLQLDHTQISAQAIDELAKFTELESLGLGGIQLSGDELAKLTMLKKLRRLGLADSPIDEGMARGLAALVDLDQLDLSRCTLSHLELLPLKALTNLKVLTLREAFLPDQSLMRLVGESGLKVDLTEADVDPIVLEHMHRFGFMVYPSTGQATRNAAPNSQPMPDDWDIAPRVFGPALVPQ